MPHFMPVCMPDVSIMQEIILKASIIWHSFFMAAVSRKFMNSIMKFLIGTTKTFYLQVTIWGLKVFSY